MTIDDQTPSWQRRAQGWRDRIMTTVNKSIDVDRAVAVAAKVVSVGSEASDILVHLQGGINLAGGTALAMRAINTIVDRSLVDAVDYLVSRGWKNLDVFGYECVVYTALTKVAHGPAERVRTVYERTPVVILRTDAGSLAFELASNGEGSSERGVGCWINDDVSEHDVRLLITRAIWEHIGTASVTVVSALKNAERLIVEAPGDALPSSKGDDLVSWIRSFHQRGLNRSIFIIGPPGVGKSCLIRYVASQVGGFTMRISISEFRNLRPRMISDAISLLRPEVLLIDDFDRILSRYDDSSDVLDLLEKISRDIRLFMVSANYSDSIQESALRPGRFDEIILIEEIDPNIYEMILVGAPKTIISKCKRAKIPVAFLPEIQKRAHLIGYERAVEEINDHRKVMDGTIRKMNRHLSRAKKVKRKVKGRKRGSTRKKTA